MPRDVTNEFDFMTRALLSSVNYGFFLVVSLPTTFFASFFVSFAAFTVAFFVSFAAVTVAFFVSFAPFTTAFFVSLPAVTAAFFVSFAPFTTAFFVSFAPLSTATFVFFSTFFHPLQRVRALRTGSGCCAHEREGEQTFADHFETPQLEKPAVLPHTPHSTYATFGGPVNGSSPGDRHGGRKLTRFSLF